MNRVLVNRSVAIVFSALLFTAGCTSKKVDVPKGVGKAPDAVTSAPLEMRSDVKELTVSDVLDVQYILWGGDVATFLANGGLRNYLFVRLTTDTGLTGLGEATLEWQEKTVQTLIHEWVEDRVLGANPYDVERLAETLIRDQYQGGSTVMTVGVSFAMQIYSTLPFTSAMQVLHALALMQL